MTYVGAIDPACGGTGHLEWRDGEVVTCQTIKTDPKWTDQHRWDFLWNAVRPGDAHRWGEPSLIMLEQPPAFAGPGGGTALLNGGLFAVITLELHRMDVPFVVVQPTQLKQYATGMGDARKREVVAAVRETYADVLPPLRTDDECDAATMLAMALDYYGRPLCTVPDKNREVLYAKHTSAKRKGEPKIHWPEWSFDGQ